VVQIHLLLNQKSMSLLKQFFLSVLWTLCAIVEPSGLILITCFFAYRFILAKKYLLCVICCQISSGFYSSVLNFFLILIACLGILTSSFPIFFLFFDFRGYALSYMYLIDRTIYTIFLEDIIYLCFFCVFLYGLHKNRSFLKREYHELSIILNVYILPYLIKKFKIVLMFIYRYIFLPVKQGFNLYKNLFIAQIKQSQWFNDLVNFYNFLLRKYLPRIKSWFNLKK
jgi:hypothetical protein